MCIGCTSGYKNTDRKDVRTFFKTFFRGFFLQKFQIFCQCSYFLSIGYYHMQAMRSVADIFLFLCQCSYILSNGCHYKQALPFVADIFSVRYTFYRCYYVLLPRPFMADMFCSDTFCSDTFCRSS